MVLDGVLDIALDIELEIELDIAFDIATPFDCVGLLAFDSILCLLASLLEQTRLEAANRVHFNRLISKRTNSQPLF